jgi:serine/threonine protein kinase
LDLQSKVKASSSGLTKCSACWEGAAWAWFIWPNSSTPIRRLVALKVIKPGTDTGEVIARFESERQALALMDHPNIARVFDAGSGNDGRPYFAMEYVSGIPITGSVAPSRKEARLGN